MVQGWLKGCWETNCEEMKRLRSIVAARLEPKSRREMEDAAIIAYTASLVSTERSHVPSVDRATLIKVTVQRKIPKALLLSSTGSSSASWSRPIETSAPASTDWFPQVLHLHTGPFLTVHLLRPTCFHSCQTTVFTGPRRRHHPRRQSLRWTDEHQ